MRPCDQSGIGYWDWEWKWDWDWGDSAVAWKKTVPQTAFVVVVVAEHVNNFVCPSAH